MINVNAVPITPNCRPAKDVTCNTHSTATFHNKVVSIAIEIKLTAAIDDSEASGNEQHSIPLSIETVDRSGAGMQQHHSEKKLQPTLGHNFAAIIRHKCGEFAKRFVPHTHMGVIVSWTGASNGATAMRRVWHLAKC